MISKTEFFRRAAQAGSDSEPGWTGCVDANWDAAVATARILESGMPSIGILSERRRIACFLAVCSQIDSLMESGQLTLDSAMLAQHILMLSSSNYSKARSAFMHRAPNISWQEAVDLPQMALEWFKAARGR